MSLSNDLQPWIQRATDFYETWLMGNPFPKRDIQTPRGWLRFLNFLGSHILGVFVLTEKFEEFKKRQAVKKKS